MLIILVLYSSFLFSLLQVLGRKKHEKVVCLRKREKRNLCQLWNEIEVVLKKTPDLCVTGKYLPECYRKVMKMPFPVAINAINELYSKVPPSVSVCISTIISFINFLLHRTEFL